jgi:hypothetical protein
MRRATYGTQRYTKKSCHLDPSFPLHFLGPSHIIVPEVLLKIPTIMMKLRSLVAFFLVSFAAGAAFVPCNKGTTSPSATSLQFGFLKDLGFEKHSWLPDFGGKKEETKSEPVAVEETPEGEEVTAEAPAED